MKKLIAIGLLLLPASALFAQTGAYTLSASVGHDNAPAKAYLMYKNASGNVTDSATLTNGAFTFKGNLTEPIKARLVVDHKGEGIRQIRKADLLSI